MKQPVVPITDDTAIFQHIEELYQSNPKFIIHIIRSNFPNCKTTRVQSFVNQGLSNRRCCLSDKQLTDISSIARYLSRRDGISFDNMLTVLMDKRTPIQQIDVDANGKTVALLGERSNRMLCLQAYNQLMQFIKKQVNDNNKDFIWIVNAEFIGAYADEIQKRFDNNIKYYKLPREVKQSFNNFIDERSIPGMNINHEYIWDRIMNTKYHNTNHKNRSNG